MVENVCEVAMLLVVVEGQHLVCMLAGFDELTNVKNTNTSQPCARRIKISESPLDSPVSSISFAQSSASALRPCVWMLQKSPQSIGSSASSRFSDFASASAGCKVAPDLLCGPAFERHPGGAQYDPQLQFAGISFG